MKTKIFLAIFFLALFLQAPKDKAFAACTGVPLSGNYTVTTSCAFENTVDGVDAGTGASNSAVITIGSGKTLTINAGQTVAYGLMSIGKPGGNIAINKTGQLVKKPLWAPNEDGDARPTTGNPDLLAQSSQPTNHSRRNVLTSLSVADCLDTDATKWQTSNFYSDTDSDTYGAATGDYTITRRSSINKSSTTALGNFVLNKPTGTAQGDTLIASIYAFSVYQIPAAASSIAAPAGWYQINTDSYYVAFSSYGRLSTFYKAAGGSEPASYTFTISNAYSGTFYNIGYIASYYNATSSAVGPSSTATNTFAASAITTASTNNMVVSVYGGSNGAAQADACANNCWSSPSGMLRFAEQSYYKLGMSGFQMLQASAASTGTKTASYTGTNGLTYSDVSIMFALKPYIGPSTTPICSGASDPSGYSSNNSDCNPQNSAETTSCP